MSEGGQRKTFCKNLKHIDARPVENRVGPGTPDVAFIGGWIELKWLRRWPANANKSPVLIPHYTNIQRLWLRNHWRLGGASWLLIQVKREWLLFDGEAAWNVGHLNRLELIAAATKHWTAGLDYLELVPLIRRWFSQPGKNYTSSDVVSNSRKRSSAKSTAAPGTSSEKWSSVEERLRWK